MPKPMLLIAGPSGVGKTTQVKLLCQHYPDLVEPVISLTTREPREGEVDGREYYFVTAEEFERRREAQELLEWAQFGEVFHGTILKSVQNIWWRSHYPVRAIDIRGIESIEAQDVKSRVVFLDTISDSELIRRLSARRSPDQESIRKRLEMANQVERPWAEERRKASLLLAPEERTFWRLIAFNPLVTLRQIALRFGLPIDRLPSPFPPKPFGLKRNRGLVFTQPTTPDR